MVTVDWANNTSTHRAHTGIAVQKSSELAMFVVGTDCWPQKQESESKQPKLASCCPV